MKYKFDLGVTILDQEVQTACELDRAFYKEVSRAFDKFTNLDWGALTLEKMKENAWGVLRQGRVLGRYLTSRGVLFIITSIRKRKGTGEGLERYTRVSLGREEPILTHHNKKRLKKSGENSYYQEEIPLELVEKMAVG